MNPGNVKPLSTSVWHVRCYVPVASAVHGNTGVTRCQDSPQSGLIQHIINAESEHLHVIHIHYQNPEHEFFGMPVSTWAKVLQANIQDCQASQNSFNSIEYGMLWTRSRAYDASRTCSSLLDIKVSNWQPVCPHLCAWKSMS